MGRPCTCPDSFLRPTILWLFPELTHAWAIDQNSVQGAKESTMINICHHGYKDFRCIITKTEWVVRLMLKFLTDKPPSTLSYLTFLANQSSGPIRQVYLWVRMDMRCTEWFIFHFMASWVSHFSSLSKPCAVTTIIRNLNPKQKPFKPTCPWQPPDPCQCAQGYLHGLCRGGACWWRRWMGGWGGERSGRCSFHGRNARRGRRTWVCWVDKYGSIYDFQWSMHVPVNAGDLSLTALVGATDNSHLIVLADGDRADLSRTSLEICTLFLLWQLGIIRDEIGFNLCSQWVDPILLGEFNQNSPEFEGFAGRFWIFKRTLSKASLAEFREVFQMFTYTCCEAQRSKVRKGWYGARETVFPINPNNSSIENSSRSQVTKNVPARWSEPFSTCGAKRRDLKNGYQYTRSIQSVFRIPKTHNCSSAGFFVGGMSKFWQKEWEEDILLFMTVILTAVLSGSGSKSRSSRSFEVSWMQIVVVEIVGCVVTWWPVY